MFLQPKKSKYKKHRKIKLNKFNFKSNKLIFGTIGLQAIESGTITSRQLEASRQAINRRLKRKGKIWIRIFPSIPVTSKPTEVRMGKGKGNVSYWVAKVSAGSIIFEICNKSISNSLRALRTGNAKLPLKTQVIT